LREAIQRANGLGGGTISLAVTDAITLASSLPPLSGRGMNFLSISGNTVCRPFEVLAGSVSTLNNLTVCRSYSANSPFKNSHASLNTMT
jgi:hypothetical protein